MQQSVQVSLFYLSACAAHTVDGHEIQFQVNHLSHMLLTLELLPIIRDTACSTGDGRIVFLSSFAHVWGIFEPENLDGQQSYSGMKFYNNSKLFNVLKPTVSSRVVNMSCFTAAGNDSIFTTEKTTERRHHCFYCSSWFCKYFELFRIDVTSARNLGSIEFRYCFASYTCTIISYPLQ